MLVFSNFLYIFALSFQGFQLNSLRHLILLMVQSSYYFDKNQKT